jgi:ribosomal protein L21E
MNKKQAKIGKVMGEYKEGTLHSGKGGKVVKNKDQALAIAISSAAKNARFKK